MSTKAIPPLFKYVISHSGVIANIFTDKLLSFALVQDIKLDFIVTSFQNAHLIVSSHNERLKFQKSLSEDFAGSTFFLKAFFINTFPETKLP
ncbi:MAG: hypothetical protein LBC61_04230 [Candidatus Peribacteria bacterium]|jgi:hypothetical protein|nr:hypothetical protein [Candidatus Peribacteria bacterium]